MDKSFIEEIGTHMQNLSNSFSILKGIIEDIRVNTISIIYFILYPKSNLNAESMNILVIIENWCIPNSEQ